MALGGHLEFCQKKGCSAERKLWDFSQVIKEDILNTSWNFQLYIIFSISKPKILWLIYEYLNEPERIDKDIYDDFKLKETFRFYGLKKKFGAARVKDVFDNE